MANEITFDKLPQAVGYLTEQVERIHKIVAALQPQTAIDKHPALFKGLKRRLCPRVHFKMMVFDCEVAYIGSANLTGAGIGMKSDGKRNFEAGILTDDLTLVDAAADHFHSVWSGEYCKSCKRKAFCTDRIK